MEWWMCCVLALVLASLSGHSRGELSISIQEPGGPFISSGPVRLQIEFSRNITLVNTHTYEIDCTSGIGTRPIWTGDGIQVPSSQPPMGTSGIYVTEDTDRKSTLVLQNLTQGLMGTYVCQEGSEQGADSATLVITTGNPTVVPGVPQLALVAQNSETRPSLHALVSATPPPQGSDVSWFFNGNQIQPGNVAGFLIVSPTEILFPRQVTRALNGTYTCVVNTTAGVENATFRVQVQTPPSLTIDPAMLLVVAISSITITCTDTVGIPAPTFTWTHNGNPVSAGGRITITGNDVLQSSRLTITSLVPEDKGTYQCRAVNPAASDTESIQVDVQYAPILSRVSRNMTTWVTGEDVLLSALLNGANPPFTTHQVTRDSQVLTDGRIAVTYTNESGSPTFEVRIPQVAVSDEGTYTLEVINTIGTGRVNFTIVVTAPPVLVPPGSFFYAAVNSIVILNFTIQEAKPPVQAANISWSFNNGVINTSSSKYTQSVTSDGRIVRLTIRNLMLVDTGQYEASVSHEALSTAVHTTINLRVKSPPNPPTGLTAMFLSECSVLASWTLMGPSPVDSDVASADVVIIEHLRSGDSMWNESVRVQAVNNSAVVRLPGGTQGTFNVSYQLRARSHSNLFGEGNLNSDLTNHFTVYREGSFPVVTNLTAVPQVPDGLKVSWLAPATDCFKFTTFDVRCISFSGGSNNTFRANNTFRMVRMASVSGLTANTRYSCNVTSSLADIRGHSFDHRTISNPVENYTFPARPDPPSTPVEAPDKPPTQTTITVRFTLPSNHEQISHYQVIVLRLSSKIVPTNPPDNEYPYGFDFASYEEVNGDTGSMRPYIAAEIAAEDFMQVFTIGESKTPDESGYLNGALQQGFPYTCFLRAFPRWLRSRSSGVVGRRQASGGERQYIVFSSSGYVPVLSTVPLSPADSGAIAPEAVTGIAVGIVIFVLVLCAFLVLMVVVVVVVRSSRQRKWRITTTPSIDSSEDHYSSSPDNAEIAVGTPDLVRKMNGGLELQSLDTKPKEFIPSGAFQVHEFLAHVEKFDANRQLLFQEEFEWITNKSPWHPSEASNDPFNDDKNRYSNITAFDHTRVKLTSIEGVECSDYINANYMAGYHDAKEYITTQGPLEQTVDDFWRMVWEQNSATIVMLTNLVETGKVKCSQYWPNGSSSDVHGSIQVTLEHSVVLPDYTIRNFVVESLSTEERRTVLQFHYTKWPDYGTPKLAAPLLNFLRAVRSSNPENVGPIIVHCSAGVGRSGTVLAIDYCLHQIKKEGIVDVRCFISKMREQRNYMVQTEQQYTFIHYAILEAIAHGNTSFPLSDFPTSYQQLKEVSVDTGKSILAEEFDRLTNVRTMVKKSSFVQRIKLKGDNGNNFNEKSDFRAHFVDTYLQPQQIVVCDGPTEASMAKFWQMVWDEGCTYIVMLTPQDEEYCRYWPNFGSMHQYGNLIVETEEDSAEHLYTRRKILLTNAKEGISHRVQQYQFMGWTMEFLPVVPTFVSFLCDVLKGVEGLEKNQRVLVHDIKSLGPSGIFCSLCYCVERLRLERMVDVFQAVQKIQLQRPGMVESMQDYAFIYDCVYEFLRTHSDSQ